MRSPEDWMDEIDNGLDYRSQFAKEDAWNTLELDFMNDESSDCSIGPNLIYSMGDSLLSSLTVPDPEILVAPEHPSAISRSPVVEAVDNWLIRKLSLKREVENAVMNSYLFSRAILKIGYDSEFGWSPYYDIGTGNNLYGMTFTQFDKKGRRIETGGAQPGMPWVRSVSPHDIVVPWGVRELDDAPWIAHRIIRPNEHIQKDPKYINKSRLEPQVSMEAFVDSYGHVMAKERRVTNSKSQSRFDRNQEPAFNILWEIHDAETGRIFVISPDYDKFLRNSVDALQIGGSLPFVSGTLVPHPRTFWSTPQAYYLGQMQHTSYDIALQAEKQRRISVLKFLAYADAMDEEELDKFISGGVGAVGKVKTARDLREVFMPVQAGTLLDFQLQSDAVRSEARDAIGFSRNQLGEYDASSRRTAREATFVAAGAQNRTTRRMNMVMDLYLDTMVKVNKICFRYWKLPRYMMVGKEWVRFTGDELEGDYLYDLTLSTKRQLSRAQRQVESLMLVTQLAQIPGVNLNEIKEYVANASSDPAFPALLGIAQGGNRASAGTLPTIPATTGGGMQNAAV